MRKVIVFTFVTMDGVLQAPGGPHEDQSNNFKWGGWTFPYWDDSMNKVMEQATSQPYDLLLGRRTYEIFAAYWPYQKDDPMAEKFNRIQKYVVSSQHRELPWENSVLLTGDVIAELKKLREQNGADLLIHGSGKLIQTLLQNSLVDELHTWIFPITIGTGKKLFAEGTQPGQWKQLNVQISTTGVIMASYVPDGDIKLGSFATEDASDLEMERRKKLAEEES